MRAALNKLSKPEHESCSEDYEEMQLYRFLPPRTPEPGDRLPRLAGRAATERLQLVQSLLGLSMSLGIVLILR